MTSIKVSFDKEIRRISLGTEEARGLSSFSTFASTIKSLFPQLANKSIFLTYIDDNFEKITVSSDAELQEAIRILRLDSSQNVLRFDVQPVGAQTVRNASVEVVVHHHVTCDECGMNPIRGIRYKCTVRDNFDLCENCEAKRPQPYAMIKITDPQQAPVALVYGIREGNGPAACPWRRGGCRRMPPMTGPSCPASATSAPSNPAPCAATPAAAAASEEIPRWKARWERRSERCGRRLNETVAPFISAFDKMVQDPKTIVPDGSTNVAKVFTDLAQGLSGAMAAALGAEDEETSAAAATKTPESQCPASVDPVNASWEDQLMQEAIQESILLNEVATAFADVDNNNKTVSSVSTATAAATAADVSVPATAVSAPLVSQPLQKPALRFIKDVTFPDGTAVQPETPFRKVWRVRNDGPFAWPVDAVLVPAGGDVMGQEDLKEALPILAAGEEREIGINLTAPSRPGLYTAYFRAQTKEKQFFGHRLWATVLVSEPVVVPASATAASAPATEEGWTNVETGHSGNASPAAAPAAVAGAPMVRVESVESVQNDGATTAATTAGTTEVQPLYLLWRKELAILADMGFLDVEVNLPLLQKHLDNTPVSLLGNNAVPKPEGMQRVIAALLGM